MWVWKKTNLPCDSTNCKDVFSAKAVNVSPALFFSFISPNFSTNTKHRKLYQSAVQIKYKAKINKINLLGIANAAAGFLNVGIF